MVNVQVGNVVVIGLPRTGPHAQLARRLSEVVTKYPGEMWLTGEGPAMGNVGDGADGRVLAQLPVCHLQTSPHDVPRRTDFFRLEDPTEVPYGYPGRHSHVLRTQAWIQEVPVDVLFRHGELGGVAGQAFPRQRA